MLSKIFKVGCYPDKFAGSRDPSGGAQTQAPSNKEPHQTNSNNNNNNSSSTPQSNTIPTTPTTTNNNTNKDFESVIRFVSLITNCLCFIYVCFFKYIYKHLLLCLIILSKATNNSTKSARKACLSNSRARKSLAIRWTKT